MKNITIVTFIVTLFLTSCERFLEEEPKFMLTDKNSITNYEKARAAVGGIYTQFQNDEWAGKLYLSLASKSGFFESFSQEYSMSYRQTSFINSSIWRGFYSALNVANFSINGINNLDVSRFPSSKEKTALMAEARILRGWINLNILWNFGHWWEKDSSEFGLIYRDEASELSNVQKPRITVGESYKHILDDLNYGIANANSFQSPRYVSKQFAQAIKAKLLLYRGCALEDESMLKESLSIVENLLSEKSDAFTMEKNLKEVYEKSWDSREVLFARYLENNGYRTASAGHNYPYGLVYAGNKLPLPVGGELNGGLEYGLDWFKTDPRWPIITGNVRSPETWDETFCFTFKKLTRFGTVGGIQANPMDEKYAVYYFRYPELYIMKSELLTRTGATISEALAPINEMRSKRISPILPPLSANTKEDLFEVIFQELVKETFLENGSEFFATLRFLKNGRKYIEVIKEDVPFQQELVCYPIPAEEMLSNKLIKQNPQLD